MRRALVPTSPPPMREIDRTSTRDGGECAREDDRGRLIHDQGLEIGIRGALLPCDRLATVLDRVLAWPAAAHHVDEQRWVDGVCRDVVNRRQAARLVPVADHGDRRHQQQH